MHSDHNKLHLQFQAHPYMWAPHYSEVIMSVMVSQIIGISIVYSTLCPVVDQNKPSKFPVTGLCEGNSPVTGEFPAQRASNGENVSI